MRGKVRVPEHGTRQLMTGHSHCYIGSLGTSAATSRARRSPSSEDSMRSASLGSYTMSSQNLQQEQVSMATIANWELPVLGASVSPRCQCQRYLAACAKRSSS